MKLNPYFMAAALVCSVDAQAGQLASIDVFTISGLEYDLECQRLQLQANTIVNVHRIDAIYLFQQKLGAGLPTNEAQAMTEMQRRFNKLSKDEIQKVYGKAIEDITLAREIGVEKVPAVVFNRKYIVYGANPMRAYELYEQKRIAAQLN